MATGSPHIQYDCRLNNVRVLLISSSHISEMMLKSWSFINILSMLDKP